MNILLLEDDIYTRKFFTELLYDTPGVDRVMDTSCAHEAVNLAKIHHPDLILLDIELAAEDLTGLEVAKQIYSFDQEAYLVFLTAHSQYAISSFAVHPYSYILKPVVIDEFRQLILEIAEKVHSQDKQISHALPVPFGHKTDFILKEDITFIEVRGKRSIINTKTGQWATYQPLDEIEKQLTNHFIRAHRSFLVNLKQIKTIRMVHDRTYEIELRDSRQKIPMSRNAYSKYKHRFE